LTKTSGWIGRRQRLLRAHDSVAIVELSLSQFAIRTDRADRQIVERFPFETKANTLCVADAISLRCSKRRNTHATGLHDR
jgi:hypothetical protein